MNSKKICERRFGADEERAASSLNAVKCAHEPGDDNMSMPDMTDFAAAVRRATLRLSLIYWTCMFIADSLLGYFIHTKPLESAPLKFVLKAYREADSLRGLAENNIPPCDTERGRPPGMGVELHNVVERLRARFQRDSQFSSGRYRSSLDIPWRLS